MIRSRRLAYVSVAAVCLVGSLALSCGGAGTPATPSTPGATPAPTPTPSSGGSGSCKLGNGSASASCDKGRSLLLDAVLMAMDRLVQARPELFDKSDEAGLGTGQYKVLDHDAYLDGLVAQLGSAGFCAQRDPDDFNFERLLVKSDNAFSETFDVLTGAGYLRRNGTYRETCNPASFPIERDVELPPAGSGCGAPYPPPVTRFNVKIHIPGEAFDNLDSTPLVGPDVAYCALIGYTDGRSLCPVRREGSPERVPCEAWESGNARDTGRAGPTWTREPDGTLCTGPASGCENHPTNQYSLNVFRGGTYRATGKNGAYGEVYVDRP